MARCTNCGKYPFCEKIENPSENNDCKEWKRREVECNVPARKEKHAM